MFNKVVPAIVVLMVLAGCSGMKPLSYSTNKPTSSSTGESKNNPKFLDISSDNNENSAANTTAKEERTDTHRTIPTTPSTTSTTLTTAEENSHIGKSERYSYLRFKYAQLLNTDADQIQNMSLYQAIDYWYGTRYQLGGTTKNGIDCSAFVQTIFATVFSITLPRMARDQYKVTRHISRTQLQEGDLLFFNTRGGVSHVGIYLQNNKFIHASVAGVMISDMFEPYYVKHFISAGRVTGIGVNSSASLRP